VAKTPGGKPSLPEVEKSLRIARQLFASSGFVVGSPSNTSQDFQALGMYGYEEQMDAVRKALSEISASDYSGPDPPHHISRELKCAGARMVQFSWTSTCFGDERARMYLKYCIKDNRFILLRIHPDWKAGTKL
jgi:hypothetical protein